MLNGGEYVLLFPPGGAPSSNEHWVLYGDPLLDTAVLLGVSSKVFRKGTRANTVWPFRLLYYSGKQGVDPPDVTRIPRMLKPPCCFELVMCIPRTSQKLCSGIVGGKWHDLAVHVTQGKQQRADCRLICVWCLMIGCWRSQRCYVSN